MSRFIRIGVAIGALTMAAAVAPPAAFADQPPAACSLMTSLRARGYLDEALKRAQAALKDATTRACALNELQAVRSARAARAARVASQLRAAGLQTSVVTALEARLAVGDAPAIRSVLKDLPASTPSLTVATALADAGFNEAASTAITDELKKSSADPLAGAARTLQTVIAQRRLEVAKALENYGEHDAAVDEVKAALRADPTISVPAELQPDDRRLPWWRELLGEVGPWVRSIAELMLVALAALALALLGVKLVHRFARRRVELGEITGGDDAGAEVARALREEFARINDQHGGTSLERVGASGDANPIPAEVSKAFPQAGIVVAVLQALDRLLPARRWRVSGTIGDGGKGAAVLALVITRRDGRVRFSQALRSRDYRWRPPADGKLTTGDWQRLATPAAVWLMFQAGRPAPVRFRHFRALGTSSWRSYASFAAGCSVRDLGDAEQRAFARRLYLDALEADPANHGAAFNLATVELMEAEATAEPNKSRLRGAARERLSDLRRALEASRFFHDDPLWYRTAYMEMFVNLPPTGSASQQAYRAGLDLASALLLRLEEVDHWWTQRPRKRALRDFLRATEGAAVAALASASAADDQEPGAAPVPTSRRAMATELRRSGMGATIGHATLAGYAQQSFVAANASTYYNLACYCVRVGDLESAALHLRRAVALGGPAMGQRALEDPDLAVVPDRANIVEVEQGPNEEPAEAAAPVVSPNGTGPSSSTATAAVIIVPPPTGAP